MGRGYYQGHSNGSALGRGMPMNGNGGGFAPNENGNGRMSSNGSYSLLPNKYSLAGNAMGAVRMGGSNMQHGGGMGGHGDQMMSPHHMPGGTYDYSFGGSIDGLDSYNGSSSMNSSDPYDQASMSLRAPSRAKGVPLQQMNTLRDKYYPTPRHNMKSTYSDEDDLDIANHSGSASSEEEEDSPGMKAENPKPERRNGPVNNKTRNSKKENSRKAGKTPKSSKVSPKKTQKDGKIGANEPDKVEQIVSKMQQEYQVYRLELDNTGPSPEELAAAKKKRGELDSAGSNSRDSGVSIGAGSIVSVHSVIF